MPATITELRQERAAVIGKLKTLSDARKALNRTFSDDERKEFDTGKNRVEELDSQLTALDGDDKTSNWIEGLAKGLDEPLPRKSEPDVVGGGTVVRRDGQGRPLSFIEDDGEEISFNLSSERGHIRKGYLAQKRQDWSKLHSGGYQLTGRGGAFKSLNEFARLGFSGGSQFSDKLTQQYLAVQGMNESIASEGGYLLMPEFAQGIIDRVYANPLWGMTDNYSMSGNNMTFNVNAETSRATGSRHGGLRGYWVPEGGAFTKSAPTFRQVTMKLFKLGVLVYLTDELMDDTGNALVEWVTRKASEEFNFMIGDALVNGTGAGQPLGILNAPSLVSVAKESGQAADTIVPENVVKMQSRFFAPNDGRSVWLHNQDIGPQLHLMVLGIGTSGQVVYMPPGGLASTPYASLQGRPMLPTEFSATLGDQGDLIKADLGQVLSISKGGMLSAASIHVEFLTDQTVLRFIMRLNARPWESAPITPYKGTATQSNFVTLDARA